MKKLLLFMLMPFALFSCDDDSDPTPSVIGQWDLVSIEHGWTGEEVIVSENTNFQTYQFRTNGTFTKTQIMDGQELEADGTYITFPEEIASSEDVKLNIELDFTEGDEIARGCFGSASESLILRHNNQLINTWNTCDGPLNL